MARLQCTQGLAGGHRLPGDHDRADRLVRGPQAAGMVHAHDTSAGHPARERDDPATGGPHRLARDAGEVHTAVARQPGPGRRRERPDHGRRHQRPRPARSRGPRRRPGPDDGGRGPIERHRPYRRPADRQDKGEERDPEALA